jgi:Ca2+-binding EF-hand superfamily protein
LKELFEIADPNQLGKIDYPAFLMLMQRYENEQRNEKKLTETFKLLDKDKGGTLDAKDLQKIMKDVGEDITIKEANEMIAFIV